MAEQYCDCGSGGSHIPVHVERFCRCGDGDGTIHVHLSCPQCPEWDSMINDPITAVEIDDAVEEHHRTHRECSDRGPYEERQ